MRKTIAFSVLAVASLLVSAVPALAQQPEPEPVVIIPNCNQLGVPFCADDFVVTTEQDIGLYWGWYAATKGLIRVFLGHTTETLDLLDSEGIRVWGLTAEQLRAKYGPIQQFDSDDFFGPGICPMPWVYVTEVEWDSLSIPAAAYQTEGTYTLIWTGSYDQPVNDAIHACKPLRLEGVLTPSLYRGDFSFVKTIEVLAP